MKKIIVMALTYFIGVLIGWRAREKKYEENKE